MSIGSGTRQQQSPLLLHMSFAAHKSQQCGKLNQGSNFLWKASLQTLLNINADQGVVLSNLLHNSELTGVRFTFTGKTRVGKFGESVCVCVMVVIPGCDNTISMHRWKQTMAREWQFELTWGWCRKNKEEMRVNWNVECQPDSTIGNWRPQTSWYWN